MVHDTSETQEEASQLGYELTALAVLMRPVVAELKRYRVRMTGDVEAAMDLMSETGKRLIGFGEPWATAS